MSNDRHKYRVWDKAENKYNGFSFHLAMSGELDRLSVDGDLLETDEDRFTIEQCTGLSDKNGKPIYEGDVVVGSWNTKLIVFWDAISASYMVKPLDKCGGDRELHYYSNMDGTLYYDFEIIGTIHDDQFRDLKKKVEGDNND